MEEKNCDLLFEYLRSILYDPEAQPLDVESLDPAFRKLGMGLQYLDKAVQEMRAYSAALSRGNLSAPCPGRDNFLCENLKNIHANLNHLTWQAKQVAKGDYSQTVSYLGEFSDAFNTMTAQLAERELTLRREAQIEKEHAEMVEKYDKLLLSLIKHSNEDILVTSVQDPRILYSSMSGVQSIQDYELYRIFREKQAANALQAADPSGGHDWTWEAEDSAHRYYRITTALMEWQGEKAYAHFIQEVTEEKQAQDRLENEAYFDKLTRIGNRYYFQNKMTEMLAKDRQLVLCYCDLDHLKAVNDTYGHAEGDWYICSFVDTVRNRIRDEDLFVRMGGDEFCVALADCSPALAHSKMLQMQADFAKAAGHDYDKSFSYGLVELPAGHGPVDTEALMRCADEAMYRQKKEHKKTRSGL